MELDKLTMTSREARRALGEMRVKLDPDHVRAVTAKIEEAERKDDDEVTKP
jgi:hypothetical protein